MPLTTVYPESTPSLGAIKVAAAVAVADLTAPKLATEIEAASSVDLSCALMAEGWTPSTTQGKATRKRRLCSRSDVEQLNPAMNQIGTILYSVGDPQNPETSIDSLMVQGALIYVIERLGPDNEDPFVVGDKVITHYLRLGVPYVIRDTGGDNGEFHMGVEATYVNGGPVKGVVAA
jgi:hypothetical protein